MSQIKTAVVFGAWCPTESEFDIACLNVDAVIRNFPNEDIFIGVNGPFYKPFLDKLKSYKNVHVSFVPDPLTIDSDASAILSALDSLRMSNNNYDFLFFGHTKGTTRKSRADAELFIANFWDQKDGLLKMASGISPNIGGVFPYATLMHAPAAILKNIGEFPYDPLPIMSTGGFFVSRFDPFKYLFEHTSPELFTKGVVGNGFDRWMLERDISSVISAMGLVPIPLRLHSHQKIIINADSYNNCLRQWSEKNGNLWIPRFRHIPVVDSNFTYCPRLWQIDALNLENQDIPDNPHTGGDLTKTTDIPMSQKIAENYDVSNLSSYNPYASLSISDENSSRRLKNNDFYDYLKREPSADDGSTKLHNTTSGDTLLDVYNRNPDKYITDKESTHRYLSEVYSDLFSQLNENFSFLEIGTYKGGFIHLVSDTYPKSKIIGCDINPLMPMDEWSKNNYQIVKIDAYKEDTKQEIKNLFGTFDIIIDDGPHSESSQFFSLEHYFDLLNPGGVLIIEDISSMPSAIMMKMKYEDIVLIDLREKNPELYITDNILAMRKKSY